MTQKATLMIAVALLGLLFLSDALATEKADVLKQVESMLAKEDTVYLADMAIPFIYQRFGDQRLTELLRSVWNIDKKKYPNLAWKSLTDEEVRLKFANLWAQWIRETQKDKQEIAAIRNFVLPYRNHDSTSVRMAAIAFTVGATEKDVEELSRIVLTDQRPVAATAVYSIVEIQGKQATKTLAELRDQVRDPALRDIIARAIKDADSPRFQRK